MRERELLSQLELLRTKLHELQDHTRDATLRAEIMEQSLQALRTSLGEQRRGDGHYGADATDASSFPEQKAA